MTDIHELLARTRKTRLFEPGAFHSTAMQFVGAGYEHLGRGPLFDCVGIGWKVYSLLGIDLSGDDMVRYPYNVREWKSELLLEGLKRRFTMWGVTGPSPQEGDVLGFTLVCNKMCHTGWYLGNRKFIHAEDRRSVRVSSLDSPRWFKRLTHRGRLNLDLVT